LKQTIYIVEDNDDIRELIAYLLEIEDFEVLSFPNATQFKIQVATHHPDLILLDVMLPDGNGVEICNRLKSNQNTQHIPVMLMSANTNVANIIEESMADDFVSKPFDIDHLVKRVKLLISR